MDSLHGVIAWIAAQAAEAPGDGAAPGQSPMNSFWVMLAVIGLLFWVIILRPQKREQAKREEMLNSLAKGDAVVTSGGIFGNVEGVDPAKGIVTMTIAPKVTIRVSRAAVSQVVQKKGKGEKADEAAEDAKADKK